jgi:hypothetical protein
VSRQLVDHEWRQAEPATIYLQLFPAQSENQFYHVLILAWKTELAHRYVAPRLSHHKQGMYLILINVKFSKQ